MTGRDPPRRLQHRHSVDAASGSKGFPTLETPESQRAHGDRTGVARRAIEPVGAPVKATSRLGWATNRDAAPHSPESGADYVGETPCSQISGVKTERVVCGAYAMLHISMGVLLQIRDLPEEVHRTLKARAAASGSSLTEYVRSLLARSAARPTPEELMERIATRGTVKLKEPSEHTVRHLRDHGE
ncbi:MAG: FitA-like ribbon-helix-helix domain-containing protein [Acidimicrobiia bacterium]